MHPHFQLKSSGARADADRDLVTHITEVAPITDPFVAPITDGNPLVTKTGEEVPSCIRISNAKGSTHIESAAPRGPRGEEEKGNPSQLGASRHLIRFDPLPLRGRCAFGILCPVRAL